MHHLLSAPPAILFEFDFALNLLFVFATPVVNTFAFFAGEFYEFVLGHTLKIFN